MEAKDLLQFLRGFGADDQQQGGEIVPNVLNPTGGVPGLPQVQGFSDSLNFGDAGSGNFLENALKNGGGKGLFGDLNFGDFADIAKGVSGAVGAYTGLKQFGLAEDNAKIANSIAKTNLANQANLVNADLTDRQRSRNAREGNSIPVADYISKFGVKGTI